MNLVVRLPDAVYARAVEAAKAKRLAPAGWLTELVKARAKSPEPVKPSRSRGVRVVGHASPCVEVFIRSHMMNDAAPSLGTWLAGVVYEALGVPAVSTDALSRRPYVLPRGHRRRMKRVRARKPCGSCSGCDEVLFGSWLRRVLAGLPTDTGGGFWARGRGEESTPREVLAAEIRDDMAKRHPFGVAVRLGAVIATLAAHDVLDDRDAIADLEDLIADERESQALNGSSATCSAWAKQADERKAKRDEGEKFFAERWAKNEARIKAAQKGAGA